MAMTTTREQETPLSPEEFRERILDVVRVNSANRGPFMTALAAGDLSPDALRRWAMEFYHFARWMAAPCIAAPHGFHTVSQGALMSKVDNAMGELGYREDDVHPNLARRLAFELGVTWDELKDYIPLPTTIWYMRQRLGAKATVLGSATNILEADNQETCAMVFEALPKHYGVSREAAAYFERHLEADVEHTEEFIAILVEGCPDRESQEEALEIATGALLKRQRVFNGWCALFN